MIILALKRLDCRTRELSFTPKHTNPKLETSTSHSTGDKCISSAVENSSMAENPFANPYSTGDKRISSAVETYWRQKTHWRTLKFSGIWSPHSTLSLQIGSPRLAHPDHASSNLFFLCSFFLCSNPYRASLDCASSSVLRSTRSWFVLLQNRVLKTWFCFLELKSIRLEIYVASCCQLTKWESSLQSSSFKLKLSLSNLKC